MGTHESVYRDSPIGKLKTRLVKIMPSLQQGFEGDSQTGFSVGIDYLPAVFATEQRIVGGVSFTHSTAVGTPFGCVPAINHIQRNVTVKTTLFKDGFELCKRDTHNNSIETFSFKFEFGKVFDGYFCIEALCKFDNLSYNLSEIGFYKITFGGFKSCEFLLGVERLQDGSSSHDLFSSCPDMFAKISLIQNLARRRENRNGKMFGVDVYSKYILSGRDITFLGKISNDLTAWQQSICFTNPTIRNQRGVSLEIPVLFNWNRNSMTRHNTQFNKEIRFGSKCLTVARDIKLNTDTHNRCGVFEPSVSYEGTNDLNIEGGVCFAS